MESSSRASAPSSLPLSPIAEIRSNVLCPLQNLPAAASPANAVATFIVSGEPKAVEGVLKAVYHDLKEGNKEASIEFRETSGPYIRIEAPTEVDVLALVATAQKMAAAHLSGDFGSSKMIFVEPPTVGSGQDSRVTVDIIGATKRARGVLQSKPVTLESSFGGSSGRHSKAFCKGLAEALEKASGLHSSLVLRIHLGYYLLESYKGRDFTLEQFENMVQHPRARGQLERYLGKPSVGDLSIEAVLRLIQKPNSPCIPMDNQTAASADVIPTYLLECWHDDDMYEAELETAKKKPNEPLGFSLVRTRMIPQSAQVPRFEAISLGIDRKLDWKIAAMPGDQKKDASHAVKQYLEEKGTAKLQGPRNNFRAYPRIHLPADIKIASKLNPITIKSIYRFYWKGTGYVVQFSINRRWSTIRDMNLKGPAGTDFDVTVYGKTWDEDSHVQAGETIGKIWGEDLRGLLQDEEGDALSRVQGLISMAMDVRDFIQGGDQSY
ncbi:hypothetical protein F5Y08DRAFT_292119 [Xylaria arbuscula]|nr:hypothetical protein F5Y08DRAFT_292119 [Xylaria arbuscula]